MHAHDRSTLFLRVIMFVLIAAFLSVVTTSFADSNDEKKSVEKSAVENSEQEKSGLREDSKNIEEIKDADDKKPTPEPTITPPTPGPTISPPTPGPTISPPTPGPTTTPTPPPSESPDPGPDPTRTTSETSRPIAKVVVKSEISSNDQESSENKYLKNGSNVMNYKAGPTSTKIPNSGKIQNFTQAKNGRIEVVSGELRFTPDQKFKGYTSFSYTSINEAGVTETYEVNIFVENKAPLLMSALSDPSKSEKESWITTDKSLRFSSPDPNGDPVKVKIGSPNKANVRVALSGNKLTLSAPRDFSGRVETAITASDNDNGVTVINAIFIVNPAEPSASSLLTVTKELHLKSGLNQMFEFQTLVTFKKSRGAVDAQLTVNGNVPSNQKDYGAIIPLPEPVGSRDLVLLKMLGNDSTESKPVKVPLTVDRGVPVARVNFDNDSWALTSGAKAILDELAKAAARLNVTAFDLSGHADANIGKNSNQSLSDKRAAAVKGYLLAKMREEGLTGLSLTTQGSSELQPIGSNKSARGLAENRRVDITLPNR